MGARFHSWWYKTRKPIEVIGFIAVLVVAIALIFIEVRLYGTGFTGKTLWDWMQLLFIPVVLAVAGFWFNHRERKAAELRAENERQAAELRAEAEREIERQRAEAEREIAEDNQREAALQAYINEMSELLLHENLRKSKPEDEVRKIARVRTLTVLPRLDGERKRSVLQFLHESGLIEKDNAIVDISGADLRGANLFGAHLRGAYLKQAILEEANLSIALLDDADMFLAQLKKANLGYTFMSRANLRGANLEEANLRGATLKGANLEEANLRGANLDGANVTEEQLKTARSLKGATMPDGSIHP